MIFGCAFRLLPFGGLSVGGFSFMAWGRGGALGTCGLALIGGWRSGGLFVGWLKSGIVVVHGGDVVVGSARIGVSRGGRKVAQRGIHVDHIPWR